MKKFTKLTNKQVRNARRMFKEGTTRAEIASDLGCSYAQVTYAINKAHLRAGTVKSVKLKNTSAKVDWKAKYMEAALILLENGLIDITSR